MGLGVSVSVGVHTANLAEEIRPCGSMICEAFLLSVDEFADVSAILTH